MWKSFIRLFTSRSCLSCENELTGQENCVCFHCLSQIEQTGFHLHPDDNELYCRFAGKVPVSGAASLFYFDKQGRLQKLLKELKYNELPQVGLFLGELYGEILKESAFAAGIEALLPVPLHRQRLISRGYNQAERIARGMSKSLGIPLRDGDLRRTHKTLTQTRKGSEDRWKNVAGAFAVQAPLPRTLLLIDDVITTGATLEAVVRAMTAAPDPPERILVASIGMARKH